MTYENIHSYTNKKADQSRIISTISIVLSSSLHATMLFEQSSVPVDF